jgi:hypothetical protein
LPWLLDYFIKYQRRDCKDIFIKYQDSLMVKKQDVKRGPGRPPLADGPSVVVAVSLPGSLAADLDAYCKAQGVGKSAAVVDAVRGFLKRKKR